MIAPQIAELIVADRIAERQQHAATARLAAIARCCRPGTWARTAVRLTAAVARLHRPVRGGRSGATPCCAGA